jgi:hypothetical protein
MAFEDFAAAYRRLIYSLSSFFTTCLSGSNFKGRGLGISFSFSYSITGTLSL